MNNLDRIKRKKVLVTGGLGFIGHNLVRALQEDYSCEVIVVDDCSNSNPEAHKNLLKSVQFHRISVLDSEKMAKLMSDREFIFHLACVQISKSEHDPSLDLKVNALSTLQMLDCIRHGGVPNLERFVYSSSCSVYGNSSVLPLAEFNKPNAISHYAASKLLGETYSTLYCQNYGIPTTALRYSNVYGYGQSPQNPYCGVLGKFIHNALTGKEIVIFGDGEQTRDYTFIDDVVSATIASAVHLRSYGEVLNVGTCVETSVNDLARLLMPSYFPDLKLTYAAERSIDNVRRRCISIENIRQRIGWIPKTNIAVGIRKTIEWYDQYLKREQKAA